jgi:hypothetical protein
MSNRIRPIIRRELFLILMVAIGGAVCKGWTSALLSRLPLFVNNK